MEKRLDSIFFLRMFSSYNHSHPVVNACFKYENKMTKNLTKLRNDLNLEEIAGNDGDIQRILKILKWADTYLKFEGKTLQDQRYDNYDWFETIKKAKDEGFALNCRYISSLFTQVLLALGYKARWVSCLPFEVITKERHCITEVYLNSIEKWIVVDAPFNLLYFDKRGNLLNLLDMRKNIIANEKIRFFTSNPNNTSWVIESWKKHIFRFKYAINNGYNLLSGRRKYFYLNPANFLTYEECFNCNNNSFNKELIYYDNERPFLLP